jgi:uncharacterized Rmd1/YagE family protein
MRCLAFCTASSYQLEELSQFFQKQNYRQQQFRNVLHIQNSEKTENAFFFQHGCFVTWGLSHAQENLLLSQIDDFSHDTLFKRECHVFVYQYGEKVSLVTSLEGNSDIITLEKEAPDGVLLKLAISYGLSQSVKLCSYETSIQKTVAENQPISHELATRGRISLSRKAIFKRIGEIFLAKSSVNLGNEYLDVSDYFWDYPHLEPHYVMVEKFLDIPKRVAVLNQRLDVMHDIVLMLNNQLEHRYSSTLEIIIIVLILGELLVNILHHYFKL